MVGSVLEALFSSLKCAELFVGGSWCEWFFRRSVDSLMSFRGRND
jgi:hypothetical protein